MPASAWRSRSRERLAGQCFPGAGLRAQPALPRQLQSRAARANLLPRPARRRHRHRHRRARCREVRLRAAGRGRAGRPGNGRGASAGGAEGGAGEVGSGLRRLRPAAVPPLPIRANGVCEDVGARLPESAHLPAGSRSRGAASSKYGDPPSRQRNQLS